MEIKRNHSYLYEGVSYLCVGFANHEKTAVLAPFWSDDEDGSPHIHHVEFVLLDKETDATIVPVSQHRWAIVVL